MEALGGAGGGGGGGKVEQEEQEEDDDAVFNCESITKEDEPNAHQAQDGPKTTFDKCVASVHA